MKLKLTTLSFLIALAALAGCRGRKAEGPAPDYEGTRRSSERGHQSLDRERSSGSYR